MSSRGIIWGLVLLATAPMDWAGAQEIASERGQQLYGELCADCHGVEGRGDGPTAQRLGLAPRNFSLGAFKCRSTPSGMPPTDQDLQRVILRGLRGTPMLGFARRLEPGDAEALIAYLKTLSPAFRSAAPPVIEIPPPPQLTDAMVLEGGAVYGLLRCWNCHGADGKGKGPAAKALLDDWGKRIRVYDFTRGNRYKCGGEDEDLYRLLHTGLTGSPMASFTRAFAFGSDSVGDPSALEPALGADAVSRITEWLDTQPTTASLDAMDEAGRQALIDHRTWSLIAYLRTLERR